VQRRSYGISPLPVRVAGGRSQGGAAERVLARRGDLVQLRAGMQLESAVSPARVIILKAQREDVEVCCGGKPMVTPESKTGQDAVPAADDGSGLVLGKRYQYEALDLEFLCTRAGAGELTVNGEPFALKEAKPLPSSD
jgi:hypothetical protein